jgi:hypothetical protein
VRKLILDVDTGTDDAVAIMFAALHPGLDLIGVTTVNGNVPVAGTTDNTLRVLDVIGRSDIPVYPGLAHPIARRGFPGRLHFGKDTVNDMHGIALPLPEAHSTAQPVSAVEYLVETLRATTSPMTLVAVGPLSNIATALAVDPSIRDAVDELVIMGGAHAYGNITASAEFYPVTDANFETESYKEFAEGYFLGREGMKWFWDQYTTDPAQRAEITASPLRASIEDLTGLPPALVITGEADVLRDEGEAYAARLRQAGVPVTAVRYQGIIHDFVMVNSMRGTHAAEGAITQAITVLRKALTTDPR